MDIGKKLGIGYRSIYRRIESGQLKMPEVKKERPITSGWFVGFRPRVRWTAEDLKPLLKYLDDGHTMKEAARHFDMDLVALQSGIGYWQTQIKLGRKPPVGNPEMPVTQKEVARQDYQPGKEELKKLEELNRPKAVFVPQKIVRWRRG